MRDPNIVVCDVDVPFTKRTLFTIWHRDPCSDGSDDSCGYTYPKVADKNGSLSFLAGQEARHPWFFAYEGRSNPDPVECETLMRALYLRVASAIGVKVTWEEACEYAARRVHCPIDNCRSSLCFEAGYHSNFAGDREQDRRCHAERVFFGVARSILRAHRPWYRHPRWHVHHWRIQVPMLQRLRRWLFTRCEVCGKRFGWGYAPLSRLWERPKARLFKGEEGLRHFECRPDA